LAQASETQIDQVDGAEAAPRRRLPGSERRAMIVEAATQLVSERGYDGMSIAELAAAAGVTKSVVYDHFASKREIHIEVLRTEATEMMTRIGQAMFKEDEPDQRVRAGIYEFFRVVQERPYSRVCLQPAAVADPAIMDAQAEIARAGRSSLALVLGPLLEGDRSQAELEMFSSVVRGAMSEMATWWDEHPDTPRDDVAEHTFQQVWIGMKAFERSV
jgi:AcrR family transcriptional regulator